eukprot:TRINITY_DN34698_c0_g1_i1.p1 TRINITY_DN34698_c0_g1~~TRINITY_DN34698_c0_g1_i1.p1  ORF type:complete len:219 (-),score=28.75 TRINITY_DN34698_c0_g1_i1:50-706(-)
MADCQHRGSIECEVVTLGGSRHVVQVNRSGTVWQLKDRITAVTQIPPYEQQLVLDKCVLRNSDTLITAAGSNPPAHWKVGLARRRMPDSLCHELLELAWRGFRAFSNDGGETVDGARVASLMRYAGLDESALLVDGELEIPGSLTFLEFSSLLAELKESFTASSNWQGIREIDLVESSDEDSDDADAEVSVNDRLAELDDPDLRCDARLILKGRQTTL